MNAQVGRGEGGREGLIVNDIHRVSMSDPRMGGVSVYQ